MSSDRTKYHLGMASYFLLMQAHRHGADNVTTVLQKWDDKTLADSCAKHHGWPEDVPELTEAIAYIRKKFMHDAYV